MAVGEFSKWGQEERVPLAVAGERERRARHGQEGSPCGQAEGAIVTVSARRRPSRRGRRGTIERRCSACQSAASLLVRSQGVRGGFGAELSAAWVCNKTPESVVRWVGKSWRRVSSGRGGEKGEWRKVG